ncbi:tyrosine-protein phosphatase non-receptor type 23 [Dendropsophus ebraccatus]|uniref:tyrosine-protein phosphatase non-receptor type 23 n=1 Tax=Dendropsophus ebraccatus TaxID=150705 RepID=UPI003832175A
MEAVPRMPMIWLDLKEAGEFGFNQAVKQFVLKNYGENPENYNEELKKLEQLRQSAVNVPRDFEGCSVLRKYFGQLHYLQSRIPMGVEQEAAIPITWTEIFSGKSVTHADIKYEQACVLYNLGALHSMLGAMDKRVSEEGMKISCTHFQCAAGAFSYLRDHFTHSYSVDMSHQILNLNINLMLGQAQECLLEKSMLDNRKSFLVARISAQVVDYYKEACRALENSETASLLGKIQKDWKKLVQMKIYYFAAIAHLHMGKQAEEQQKYGEQVAYLQSALDKLNEAIKQSKGQPSTVQEALRFTMDVIGGKFNSAKKDNDFIYHESVPAMDTLQAVKGAPLVKALPVNPTDPAVTGPDIFSKLVPMAAHEASSLYSEEKAKLLREVMAKIDAKNEVLDQFTDSLQLDPETVDNLDMYSHIPPSLMEKCAALSVRPDTVKSLVQSMQALSGVFTDVEASLKDIKDILDEEEKEEKKLQDEVGKANVPPSSSPAVAEVSKEWTKYMEVHEKASFTNTELHKAMNLHISNLRLLSGPLDQLQQALPAPTLTEEDKAVLQNLKRILGKVQEMREQRLSLEQQLRDTIQKDDITTSLVTTDRSEMKKLFAEQLKKYDQLKVYIDQNLSAQENILKALTEANVKYAPIRKVLTESEQKWNHTVQTLISSYEAYEDLMKKCQEGRDFYADLESKVGKLLEKARAAYEASQASRLLILEREMKKKPPPRPTAPKPALEKKVSDIDLETLPAADLADMQQFSSLFLSDLPEELKSLPPEALLAHLDRLSADAIGAFPVDPAVGYGGIRMPSTDAYRSGRMASAPMPDPRVVPFSQAPFNALPGQMPQMTAGAVPGHTFPPVSYGNIPPVSSCTAVPPQPRHPSVSQQPPLSSQSQSPNLYSAGGPPVQPHHTSAPMTPGYIGAGMPAQRTSPKHVPVSAPGVAPLAGQYKPGSAVGFGMGQASSASVVSGPMNPSVPNPSLASTMRSQVTQSIRPATTTVDSIQGPISSYAAARMPAQVPAVPPPLQPSNPQGGYMGAPVHPAMGQSQPFPYSQGGIPNYVQTLPHVPSSQPNQMFHVPGQPQPFPGQSPYAPHVQHQYNPQIRAPLHPQQPPVYPQGQPARVPLVNPVLPQQQYQYQQYAVQPPHLVVQPQTPHMPMQPPHTPVQPPHASVHPQTPHMPVQPPHTSVQPLPPHTSVQPPPLSVQPHTPHTSVQPPPLSVQPLPPHTSVQPSHSVMQPQPSPHIMPQRYPLAHQDNQAQQPVHTTFPGAIPRASPQPVHTVPLPMSQPSQILPHSAVPGSAPQVVSPMPFGPSARHPIPPSNAIVNSMPPGPQMPMAAPQTPSLAHHVQPPGSPALSQLPGGAIVSGAAAIPSPAPSPQPSLVVQPPAVLSSTASTSTPMPQRPPPSLTPGTTPLSQASTEPVFHRQSSTTDDLLSSSPESQHGGSKTAVGQPLLQPTKADSKDGLKPKVIQLIENDPYEKPEHIMRLLSELDRFRLVVAALDKPVPGAATQLDSMWKEFQDAQEKEARNLSIAIARCYTMKNRHQDIMPYDKNRIVLQSGKDDYINASRIEDLSPYCPTIIATQAPLVGTAADFWLMIYEQKVSLIVMLVSDLEIEKQKVVRYFPTERGQPVLHGHITLTLTSHKVADTHVERVISLQYKDQSLKRSIIHLQFTSWPELGLPDSKGNLLRFIQDVHKHYLHQRPLHMPIVVHCSSGVGRSGAFSLLYAAVQEVEAGNGIPELAELVKKMRQQRKHMLQEKIHLKFCYEAVLKHAEQVLQRHGFYTPSASKPQPSATQKIYSLQDPQDIVLGGDMPISSIQATIAKLSIKPSAGGTESGNHYQPPPLLDTREQAQQDMVQPVFPPSSSQPDLTSILNTEPQTPPVPSTTNGINEAAAEITNSHDPTPVPEPSSASPAPSSSSLNLLASLTPETFNLDSSQRGKQKMNKQSFLQPQNGSGLARGGKSGDDPLNMLDPLWTLNKT